MSKKTFALTICAVFVSSVTLANAAALDDGYTATGVNAADYKIDETVSQVQHQHDVNATQYRENITAAQAATTVDTRNVSGTVYRQRVTAAQVAAAGNPHPITGGDYKMNETMAQVDHLHDVHAGQYREDVNKAVAAAAGNPKPVNATEYREAVSAAQAAAAGNPKPVNATEYRQSVNAAAGGYTGDAVSAVTADTVNLDQVNSDIAANSAKIASTDARLGSLETSTNKKFADLNKTVNDNRKRASAGIAGVAAMANIPQVTQGQSFSVGAGVGNTDGESALAVGASARLNDNWVVKASVSDDTQSNFVVGAGASYGW